MNIFSLENNWRLTQTMSYLVKVSVNQSYPQKLGITTFYDRCLAFVFGAPGSFACTLGANEMPGLAAAVRQFGIAD